MNACNQARTLGREGRRLVTVPQPRHLIVLARKARLFEAHPLVESINKKEGTHLRVVPYRVADLAVTDGEKGMQLPKCTVDASIAYEAKGKRLGEKIVFESAGSPKVVQATGDFKGEKDIALAAQELTSADVAYMIKDKGQRSLKELLETEGLEYIRSLRHGRDVTEILQFAEDRLIAVPGFEYRSGCPIPTVCPRVDGKKGLASANGKSRYLYGVGTTSYVGRLVRARNTYDGEHTAHDDGGKDLYAGHRASEEFPVVAEATEWDVRRLSGSPTQE